VDRDQRDRGNEAIFHVPDRIPVFPLPNVVFFPKTYLPLHIFEPRYREMVADVAAQTQCLGVTLLKAGWEHDYYGNPPVYEVGCVGRLVRLERLPDGRSNILLQGLHRFDICEEFFDKRYREATIALKPTLSDGSLEVEVRAELVRVVEHYLRTREDANRWHEFLHRDITDEVLINNLSSNLEFTPLEKQFLLEADTSLQRARRLIDLIHFNIYERDGAKGWS